MSSSPPFQVEDQTDADFFDKLVDDDDDFGGGGLETAPSFAAPGGIMDSDDVQAFSNLSISEEVGTMTEGEDFGGFGLEGDLDQSKDVIVASSTEAPEKDILVSEESVSLVSLNTIPVDNVVESSDVMTGANASSDSTTSRGIGIKEVQWNLFNADSAQNGEGLYSEFFTDLGDNGADPFANLGDSLKGDPFANVGDDLKGGFDTPSGIADKVVFDSTTSSISAQHQDEQAYVASTEQTNGQDLYDSQYWDSQYPGWRYDPNTGNWIQVDGYDATASTQGSYGEEAREIGNAFVSDQKSEVSYLQQTAQSVVGSVSEGCTTGSVSMWNQVQQGTTGYPEHMVFDPQYPGWYYDTITQEWRILESYDPAIQSTNTAQSQQLQSWNNSNGGVSSEEHSLYGDGQVIKYSSQNLSGQNQGGNWAGSSGNYAQQNANMWQSDTVAKSATQQNTNMWQPETVGKIAIQQNTNMWQPETVGKSATQQNTIMWQPETIAKTTTQQNTNMWQPATLAKSPTQQNTNMWQSETVAKSATQQNTNMWQPETIAKSATQQNTNTWQSETVAKSATPSDFTENQKPERLYGSRDHPNSIQDQQMGFKPRGNTFMYEQTSQNHVSNDVATGFQSFVPSENSFPHFNQHMLEQSQQKLSSHNLYGSQNSGFPPLQPYQADTQLSSHVNEGRSACGRPPHALVTFGFGGKLIVMKECSSYVSNSAYGTKESVGGSISVLNIMDVVGDKNDTTQIGLGVGDYFSTLCQQSYPGPLVGGSAGVNKWIDERITKCEALNTDYRRGELLRLLLSLLKIASQNYGKLRSPFGTDPSLKGTGRPEVAVAELFSSFRKNDAQLRGYGAIPHCLQTLPSNEQLWATAAEVQNLLVSGKRIEALQCAQEGQFWGYALQLAADLGEQFYMETAKQMAHRMLVAGSPLKTLSLLMAGQPADVFSVDNSNHNGLPGAVNMFQHHGQISPNGMLDDWEKNLAIITANRTKGDELVILHLGDCLWKERGEIIGAHICYLLAEQNFESFSDGARLCLIGADHWKFPRTYASPEAIQRTEFYEYSMVLGNSQSVLVQFQPYKLIYAYMLAEVGRLSDSLKYCQAILKPLKNNRAPEVDAWKQLLSSLEDRIRAHQQSGFGSNLAPTKLVGKFLNFLDNTSHRIIGPPPPPLPSGNGSEHDNHPLGPRVANSQSTMAMQSLMPSTSTEPINAWASGGMPNRSVSEPDFGRSPRQVNSSTEASSSDTQGKNSGGPSRFGRLGSNILQKTVGWVRSRPDRQAKLGEKNKFYYDEKLKRWVEEGAAPPAEEMAPPPPPKAGAFQNGTSDYNIKNAIKGNSSPANGGAEIRSPPSSERSSGIPPIPPSSNQFSARGRMALSSRYVDTFNKGGGAPTSFTTPSVVAAKPRGGANAKFFIPTPTSSGEQTANATGTQENAAIEQDPSTIMPKDSFSSPPPPSSSSIQRFPSLNSITPTGSNGMGTLDNENGSLSSRSRRTASWSGGISGALNPPKVNEIKPLREALGMSPLSSMPSNPSTMHMPMNGGSFGDDLHEVEL